MRQKKSPSPQSSSPPKVGIISLGCPKNLVDSEVMAGYLAEAGFGFVARPEEAEVIVVNTCSFIGPAVEEAKQSLREMVELKRHGNCRILLCAGCLPQREGQALAGEFPEVDAFLRVDDLPHVAKIAGRLLGLWSREEGLPAKALASAGPESGALGQNIEQAQIKMPDAGMPSYLYDDTTPRLQATPPWTAYVKIAEGCLHRCSFCTIPAIRGRFRSRRPESVVREVEGLARRGVKEIVLIAQDSTAYGRDNGASLPALLRRLEQIPGIRWIRLMYSFPGEVTKELLAVMADSDRICHYLDLPLQHAHPAILRRMHRAGSGESYLEMIARLRAALPDIALRSAFIVGFPGEGEREFQALLDFLQQAQSDRVGAFIYCREAGTAAAEMEDQVPAEIARERYERLMLAQQEISRQKNLAWVGKELQVLVETVAKKGLVGRSFRDAPEIDGEVIIEPPRGKANPKAGEFVTAEITGAAEYDLSGRLANIGALSAGRVPRKKRG